MCRSRIGGILFSPYCRGPSPAFSLHSQSRWEPRQWRHPSTSSGRTGWGSPAKAAVVEDAVDITAIADVISEIIDNFAQHSGQQLASLAMQYRPRWHQIAIALGDCGVGIRQSLATQPKYSYLKKRPDWLAARMAFQPLVTSKREGGMGLVDAKESILHMGGRLFLSTGKGYVEFSGARTYYGDMAYNLPGVQIILSIPERT